MRTTKFTTPIDERYFQDYAVGSLYEFGDFAVTEADVINFAKQFDPQYIHTDALRARSGPFQGLIASGWHSGAIISRLVVDHYLSHVASLGSPGVDEMRWIRPVRPGDKLRLRIKVLEARVSKSKPDRGLVTSGIELINQADQPVVSLRIVNLLRKALDCLKSHPARRVATTPTRTAIVRKLKSKLCADLRQKHSTGERYATQAEVLDCRARSHEAHDGPKFVSGEIEH